MLSIPGLPKVDAGQEQSGLPVHEVREEERRRADGGPELGVQAFFVQLAPGRQIAWPDEAVAAAVEEIGVEFGSGDHSPGGTVGEQVEDEQGAPIQPGDGLSADWRLGGREEALVVSSPTGPQRLEALLASRVRPSDSFPGRAVEREIELGRSVDQPLDRRLMRQRVSAAHRFRRQRADGSTCAVPSQQGHRRPAAVEHDGAARRVDEGGREALTSFQRGAAAHGQGADSADAPGEHGLVRMHDVVQPHLAAAGAGRGLQDRGVAVVGLLPDERLLVEGTSIAQGEPEFAQMRFAVDVRPEELFQLAPRGDRRQQRAVPEHGSRQERDAPAGRVDRPGRRLLGLAHAGERTRVRPPGAPHDGVVSTTGCSRSRASSLGWR